MPKSTEYCIAAFLVNKEDTFSNIDMKVKKVYYNDEEIVLGKDPVLVLARQQKEGYSYVELVLEKKKIKASFNNDIQVVSVEGNILICADGQTPFEISAEVESIVYNDQVHDFSLKPNFKYHRTSETDISSVKLLLKKRKIRIWFYRWIEIHFTIVTSWKEHPCLPLYTRVLPNYVGY